MTLQRLVVLIVTAVAMYAVLHGDRQTAARASRQIRSLWGAAVRRTPGRIR
jgi:hypothetical protein